MFYVDVFIFNMVVLNNFLLRFIRFRLICMGIFIFFSSFNKSFIVIYCFYWFFKLCIVEINKRVEIFDYLI